MALLFFILFIDDLVGRLERERRIREELRKAAELSARNFRTGIEEGLGTVEKLAALLRFKEVVERLILPKSIKISAMDLLDHLEDYAVDLEIGLHSAERASRFATDESWRRAKFAPQALQPGSCGERFHRGAAQYLEHDCQEIAEALQAHYTSEGVVTEDELAFMLQFKEFAEALNAVMKMSQ